MINRRSEMKSEWKNHGLPSSFQWWFTDNSNKSSIHPKQKPPQSWYHAMPLDVLWSSVSPFFSVYFVPYLNSSASWSCCLHSTVNLNYSPLLFVKQNSALSLIFPPLASVWEASVHGYFGGSWSPFFFRREGTVLTPGFLRLLLYWKSVHE